MSKQREQDVIFFQSLGNKIVFMKSIFKSLIRPTGKYCCTVLRYCVLDFKIQEVARLFLAGFFLFW